METAVGPGGGSRAKVRLPGVFVWFAIASAVCTAGLVTFGLIGFHLVEAGVVATAGIAVLYAVGMAAEAVAALGTGVVVVVCGIVVWGAAVGVQDSTVKAFVADLVPREQRATAYGVFAAVQGVGALVGGAGVGVLYEHSRVGLVGVVAVAQVAAFVVLVTVAKRR